jgi:hypothetical protein
MAAAAPTDALLDAVLCAICLSICTLPCSTACGHNMSQRCIQALYRSTPGAKTCPTCRAPLPKSAGDLKPNTALEQMIAYLLTVHPSRGPPPPPPPPPHPLAALRLPLLAPPVPALTSPFHALQGGIQRVLTRVHPALHLTPLAASLVVSMIGDVLERFTADAARLCARGVEAVALSMDGYHFTRAQLDEICKAARCSILNSITNEHVDAYLLSESSLFVYPRKIIMKTCGTTTLLRWMDKNI